jgi:hypothetical protein
LPKALASLLLGRSSPACRYKRKADSFICADKIPAAITDKWKKRCFTNPKIIDYYNTNFISYKFDMEDGGAAILRRLDEKIGAIKGKEIFVDYADGTGVQTQIEGHKD